MDGSNDNEERWFDKVEKEERKARRFNTFELLKILDRLLWVLHDEQRPLSVKDLLLLDELTYEARRSILRELVENEKS